jgi:hypothetical protein
VPALVPEDRISWGGEACVVRPLWVAEKKETMTLDAGYPCCNSFYQKCSWLLLSRLFVKTVKGMKFTHAGTVPFGPATPVCIVKTRQYISPMLP